MCGRFFTPGAVAALNSGDYYSFARVSRYGVALSAGESSNETLLNAPPEDNDAHLISAYLNGARSIGWFIGNSTGQSVDVDIFLYHGVTSAIIYSDTLTNGQTRILAPGAPGIGASASYIAIPALAFPVFLMTGIRYQMPSGTATGSLQITLGRMT